MSYRKTASKWMSWVAQASLLLAMLACSLPGALPQASPASTPPNPAATQSSPAPQNPTPTPLPPSPTPEPALQPTAEATAPSTDQNNAAPGANQCQNPYYPVAQGASWQYQLSGTSSGTFTRTHTAVRADGFDDQDVFSAGTTRQGSWACQNGNLISLTPSSGATVSTADMQADFTIESNTGLSFPANPQPGQEWAQNIVYLGQQTTGGMTIESRNLLATSCKAGNIETVKVPAGEFSALRIDCSTKIEIYISGGLAFTFTDSSSAWHAPGVGLVKSVGTSNMGSTEIVLLAYAIP